MNLKEKLKTLCEERGTSFRKLEIDLGFSNGSVNKWDKVTPSADKLLTVANYFGVSPSYFFTEEEVPEYYIDPEVASMMQELKDNPELKILFDASKKLKKDDLLFILNMIERMK